MAGSTKTRSMTARTVRTKRDRIMILVGVALIILFLLALYVSIDYGGSKPGPKKHGPVRNPKVSSVILPHAGTGRLISKEGHGRDFWKISPALTYCG